MSRGIAAWTAPSEALSCTATSGGSSSSCARTGERGAKHGGATTIIAVGWGQDDDWDLGRAGPPPPTRSLAPPPPHKHTQAPASTCFARLTRATACTTHVYPTCREPEKVSTTSIETREPLLDGHTLVATPSTRFELTPPQLESPASNSDGADAAVLHQHQQLAQQQPLQQQAERPPSPGRFSHPWRVHADDGGLGNHAGAGAGWARARAESGDMSSTAAASSSSTSGFNSSGNTGSSCSGSCSTSGGGLLLTPQVGQAMDDIFLFADEMQRELAQHGERVWRVVTRG